MRKLVIMDLSVRLEKRDILYELGIAHGLLKPVIMIAKEQDDDRCLSTSTHI